jgi:ABC-type uncharacterized transport system auxiliary subunit
MIKKYSLVIVCLFGLYGCIANIPPTHYYTFQPGGATVTESDAPKYPYVIGVEGYEADVPYQQDKIVFRTSAYEVNFYEYRRWLRPPTELVMEQALKLLTSSGMFQNVHAYAFESYADYILQGRIIMFDQWYTGATTSSVKVGILHQLVASEEGRIVWMDTIETTATSSSLEILETIKSFEAALQDNILQAITAIDHALAQGT